MADGLIRSGPSPRLNAPLCEAGSSPSSSLRSSIEYVSKSSRPGASPALPPLALLDHGSRGLGGESGSNAKPSCRLIPRRAGIKRSAYSTDSPPLAVDDAGEDEARGVSSMPRRASRPAVRGQLYNGVNTARLKAPAGFCFLGSPDVGKTSARRHLAGC